MDGLRRIYSVAAVLVLAIAGRSAALVPAEVAVVGNENSGDSVALARDYLKRRQIPAENLLLLKTSTRFAIGRPEYEQEIAGPVRRFLSRRRGKAIRAACLVYGVPVHVDGAGASARAGAAAGARNERPEDAAVDSELALVLWDRYDLRGPVPNPLYWRKADAPEPNKPGPVILTARLDGPSREDVSRMIATSAAVERNGLHGVFYIDAGGKVPQYDQHLRSLHQIVQTKTKLRSRLDTQPAVLPAGSCPQAALYVGWHSPRRYVPAFMWVPGAVGWHIASFEAKALRNPSACTWCAKMIQNGVAATLGAVGDPTLGAFPLPQDFFPLLLSGKCTVAECYWRTVPWASWRLTLIGDVLYNPCASAPQMRPGDLPAGLLPP